MMFVESTKDNNYTHQAKLGESVKIRNELLPLKMLLMNNQPSLMQLIEILFVIDQ